jgi:hypothetical protein
MQRPDFISSLGGADSTVSASRARTKNVESNACQGYL